jgi:hypothetical protein
VLPSRQFAQPPSREASRAARIGARLVSNQAALGLLGYAALAFIVCAAAWRSPASVAVGNPLDLPEFLWFLRWYPFAIAHGQSLLLSDYIAYPGGVNLMWNTSIPLLAVLLSPVTVLASPVIALNLLTTLGPALSAWTAFLALRRYVLHGGAALVGGAVFGFSPYVMSQSLGHPQLAFAALVPLIFMTLDEILIRQRRRAVVLGVALGALGAAQLLVGEEVLLICAITALVGTVLLAALHRRQVAARLPFVGAAVAVATLTFGLLAAYPISVQLFGPEQAHGPLQPASIYVTNVLALVIPSVRQLFAPGSALELSRHFSGTMENGGYLGLPLIGLVYWMARRQWSRGIVRWAVLLTTTIVVLSMGSELRVVGFPTGVPLPWHLVGGAPVLDHLLPVRLMGMAFLSAGLLVALFVDQAMASGSGMQRRFALAVTGLALLALVPRPLPVLPATPPPFFTTGAISQVRPGSVALVAPFSQAHTGSVAMGWQAQAGFRFRMPDGYAYGPNWLSPPDSETQSAMVDIQLTGERPLLGEPGRQRLLEELRRWHVETVIVGPMDNQPLMVDFMTWLLGRPPAQTGGVFVWWNVDRAA